MDNYSDIRKAQEQDPHNIIKLIMLWMKDSEIDQTGRLVWHVAEEGPLIHLSGLVDLGRQ